MVMQTPSSELCVFALKAIDILTDDQKSRILSESIWLLQAIEMNIIESIIDSINKIEKEEVESSKILSPAMSSTRDRLKGRLRNKFHEAESAAKADFDLSLIEIANALKLFNFCGLMPKVDIKDIKGTTIC
jgi:hypothetical protein